MSQISPIYKRKVTKESFKDLVEKNSILNKVKELFMAHRNKQLRLKNLPPQRLRELELKEKEKCITQLVVKLESIFTTPDILYLQQEDDAVKNPADPSKDDDEDSLTHGDSFMYFIRNGKFSVHVKTDHLKPVILDESAAPKPVTYLIDGDHFGEIGMIFDSKRTATVRCENYGTLAMLKKTHYLALTKTFDSLSGLFKKNIFKY